MQRVNLKEVRQEGRNEQETVLLFDVRSDRMWIIASLVVKNSPVNAGDL